MINISAANATNPFRKNTCIIHFAVSSRIQIFIIYIIKFCKIKFYQIEENDILKNGKRQIVLPSYIGLYVSYGARVKTD